MALLESDVLDAGLAAIVDLRNDLDAVKVSLVDRGDSFDDISRRAEFDEDPVDSAQLGVDDLLGSLRQNFGIAVGGFAHQGFQQFRKDVDRIPVPRFDRCVKNFPGLGPQLAHHALQFRLASALLDRFQRFDSVDQRGSLDPRHQRPSQENGSACNLEAIRKRRSHRDNVA